MLHIDLPTRDEVEKLAGYRASPAVSIYLRTTPVTQNTKADRIELKNLLKVAITEMEEAGFPKRSISSIHQSVETLINDDLGKAGQQPCDLCHSGKYPYFPLAE